MKGSVGRIVHFYSEALAAATIPGTASPGYNGQGAGPYVGVITQVFPGGPYANLKVLPPFGAPFDECSVTQQNEEGTVTGRYWTWPPREG